MSGNSNRKRTKKRAEEDTSLWGFLFDKDEQSQDITKTAFFGHPGEDEETESQQPEKQNILQIIWKYFNFWSIIACTIFIVFTFTLTKAVIGMWTPQNMRDIAGYSDNGSARDLCALLSNANGQEISFTEAEINRYLRETCRLRQTGIFSIITHGQGVAVRIHDGYAEVVIDRMIGANIHQTTSVNVAFDQQIEHGRPILKVQFKGDSPLIGDIPNGGSIGTFALPDRHISMLAPALRTLLDCYPEITALIEEHGYCPFFTKGQNGNESRIRLVPYRPA